MYRWIYSDNVVSIFRCVGVNNESKDPHYPVYRYGHYIIGENAP